jgi:hypothetical protein
MLKYPQKYVKTGMKRAVTIPKLSKLENPGG